MCRSHADPRRSAVEICTFMRRRDLHINAPSNGIVCKTNLYSDEIAIQVTHNTVRRRVYAGEYYKKITYCICLRGIM